MKKNKNEVMRQISLIFILLALLTTLFRLYYWEAGNISVSLFAPVWKAPDLEQTGGVIPVSTLMIGYIILLILGILLLCPAIRSGGVTSVLLFIGLNLILAGLEVYRWLQALEGNMPSWNLNGIWLMLVFALWLRDRVMLSSRSVERKSEG